MTSLDGLFSQVRKIVEKAPKPVEPMVAYVYILSEDEQAIVDRFLAIDEMRIPSKAQFIPLVHPFGFHREHFRYARGLAQAAIEHNRISCELDELREWLARVELHGANYGEGQS